MNRKISFNTAAHNNEVKEIKNKFENFKELYKANENFERNIQLKDSLRWIQFAKKQSLR